MTTESTLGAPPGVAAASPDPAPVALDIKPLMLAYMACTMAMMAFVSLIGPMARLLHLAAWQAGTVVTIGGVLWMLLARVWGHTSDRLGRRPVLLVGVSGFMLSYWALCVLLVVSLQVMPSAWLVFAGLVVTRGAVGGFFAAMPSVGQALVADHLPPERRARTMASLGAANALGLVLGPAIAAVLSQVSLTLPLYVTAVLPAAALLLLWKGLPRSAPVAASGKPPMRLADPRLRRAMTVAFVSMFCVAIAQITVGFFAIDRLGLAPAAAARAAGLALTMVGCGLIVAQLVVRRLDWPPARLIRVGAAISAVGFGSVAFATTHGMMVAGYFVAAAGMGGVFPAFSAMASNAVEPHEQGAAAGSIGAAQGLGIVLGPLAGTLLYEAGPGVPFLLAFALLAGVSAWSAVRRPAPSTH